MTQDEAQVRVTVKTKLLKFDEGVDTESGAPFETIEGERVFVGEEAIKIIKQVNEEAKNNGSN